jgi:3-dehydroquinate synthase
MRFWKLRDFVKLETPLHARNKRYTLPTMILLTKNIASTLTSYLSSHAHDKVFVLTDTHTRMQCLPLLSKALHTVAAEVITIEADDTHKDLAQVVAIWDRLSKSGASRHSLLINLGGGMVTDLGGFVGATFKRGLYTLNIPTTLMASVDAAVGGKTGINFNGLKNEIGAFYPPDAVLIDCVFLRTLDRNNLLSGYAEVIKHGLISDPASLDRVLAFDIGQKVILTDAFHDLVDASVRLKERIVAEDPKEEGLRKALNFGHTIGHALESLSFARHRPLLHGHAVAAGIIGELYLSYKLCGLSVGLLRRVTNFIKAHYPSLFFRCDDYDALYEYMTHDKKNEGGRIFFTLLSGVGDLRLHQAVDHEMILDALDFYREN